MQAREPDEVGVVDRDGVRIGYELYGSGEQTVFLLPAWSIVHARSWKHQVPYFARHYRVLSHDPRGNGRSDAPRGPDAYSTRAMVLDALAGMDATGTEHAALVGTSRGPQRAVTLAAEHPERVTHLVLTSPSVDFAPALGKRIAGRAFDGRTRAVRHLIALRGR